MRIGRYDADLHLILTHRIVGQQQAGMRRRRRVLLRHIREVAVWDVRPLSGLANAVLHIQLYVGIPIATVELVNVELK